MEQDLYNHLMNLSKTRRHYELSEKIKEYLPTFPIKSLEKYHHCLETGEHSMYLLSESSHFLAKDITNHEKCDELKKILYDL